MLLKFMKTWKQMISGNSRRVGIQRYQEVENFVPVFPYFLCVFTKRASTLGSNHTRYKATYRYQG